MRISFDLDGTLICYEDVPRERPLPLFLRLLVGDEPLRQGSRELLTGLRRRGWEVWIYTTSLRSPRAVRRWLRLHGIRVGTVINQAEHERRHAGEPPKRIPTKNPTRFGIDLHVDDSAGVGIEGNEHGFDVVVVSPDDVDWTRTVLQAVERIEAERRAAAVQTGR